LQRIFEHFNQADSTATRAQGGLGLGLSIVRHIVRMHGGSIEARSAGVDRGSEFVVTLPRLKTVASPPAPSNARRLGPDALGGLSILVVDDEESARVVAEASLTKFGATVLTASSANEALHILANGTGIDVVISDIGMPVVSGFELVRSIRASVPPVFSITASATASAICSALGSSTSSATVGPTFPNTTSWISAASWSRCQERFAPKI